MNEHVQSEFGMLDSILSLDRRIRYVAIISEDLKQVEHRMKKDAVSYSPRFIDEVVVPILVGILKRLTEYIGGLDYCAISYEKVKVLILRLSDGFLLLSVEPTVDMPRLYGKAKRLARKRK